MTEEKDKSKKEINFKFDSIQFVLFPELFNLPAPNERAQFLSKFKEAFKYSQEMILPIPNDAPEDIPVMILSKKDEYEIRFSKKRIDFNFFYTGEIENIKEIFGNQFMPEAKKFFNVFIDNFLDVIKVKDIGCIIRYYTDDYTDPNAMLKESFNDQKNIFNYDPDSHFLVRNLVKKNVDIDGKSISAHKIIVLHTNKTIQSGDDKKRILFIELDMNTFPEKAEKMNEWAKIEIFLLKEIELNQEFQNKVINN